MTPSTIRPRRRRGFTLVETIVAMGVLAVGLTGMAALQVVGVKSAQMGKRLGAASQLANELAENVQRWEYNDARLAPLATVTSTTDSKIGARWEMGRKDADVQTANKAQFSETSGDRFATSGGALGADYAGQKIPIEDGKPIFNRYWSVFALDIGGSGVPQGKLIQIVVRWKEPGVGFRQVAVSTFKPNQAVFLQ